MNPDFIYFHILIKLKNTCELGTCRYKIRRVNRFFSCDNDSTLVSSNEQHKKQSNKHHISTYKSRMKRNWNYQM